MVDITLREKDRTMNLRYARENIYDTVVALSWMIEFDFIYINHNAD